MAAVRSIHAEVNLKGNASGELKNLNQEMDKTEGGFTSLTDEANKLIGAQQQGSNATSLWGLAFKAFSAFGVVDLLGELAFGAFSFAYSADEASLSTKGWMASLQKTVASVLEPFVETIKSVVDAFMQFKEWLFNTEEGMRLIYSTLIALSPVIGYFLVLGVWTLVAATYAWVVANWALIASYAPLILLWLSIAAAVAFVVLVIDDFITWMQGGESFFGDWFGEWQGWGEAFTSIWEAIKNGVGSAWNWIVEKTAAAWDWVKSLFSGGTSSVSGTGSTIISSFGRAIDWLKENLGAAWDWLKGVFGSLSNTLATEYPRIGKIINTFLIQPLNFVLGIVQTILKVIGMITPGNSFRDMADNLGNMRQALDGFGVVPAAQGGPGASGSQQPQISGQRASGGPVNAGEAYIVGEEGPEILQMGSKGGNVISNKSIGGGRNFSLSIGNITLNVSGGGVKDAIVSQVREAMDILAREDLAVAAGLL